MRLTTTIAGYEAWIDAPDSGGTYRVTVPALRDGTGTAGWESARFPSVEAAEIAINKYDLSLRKGFGNPTAYYHARGARGIEAVTVTSIGKVGGPGSPNGEAWIKRADGRREKADRGQLFADPEEVGRILQAERDVELRWKAAKRWAPEFAAPEVA